MILPINTQHIYNVIDLPVLCASQRNCKSILQGISQKVLHWWYIDSQCHASHLHWQECVSSHQVTKKL